MALVGGATFGTVTSMSNVFGSGYGPFTKVRGEGVLWLQFVSKWLDSLWAWALLPFVVGWLVRRAVVAAVVGTSAVIAALCMYYLTDAALGMTASFEITALVSWIRLAVLGAPLMAVIGAFARGSHPHHLLAGLVAPFVMTYVVLRQPGAPSQLQQWSNRSVLLTAVLLAAALVTRSVRRSRASGGGRDS